MSAVVAIVVLAVGLVARMPGAWAVLVGFAVLTPVEAIFRRHRQAGRRPGLATDVVHFVLTRTLNSAATMAGALVVWLPFHRLTPTPLDGQWRAAPEAVVALVSLAVLVFVSYWHHRLSHAVPLLWRFHAVHHSSRHLDWLAAARLHPLEGFSAGILAAPFFVGLGLPPGALGPLSALTTLWAVVLHANVSFRLPRLGVVIGSPELHHWHHAQEAGVAASNFSALAPWLDKVFGTYWAPSERRPQHYGIDEPMPATWWGQMAHPFRRRPALAPTADAI